jgi:uncharacterized phage-associated protein
MVSVHDVAAYILEKQGAMSAMKLQKLVYYCQAWSLVWEERPLFPEAIEAWANGPVVPELYDIHRGQFKLSAWPKGNSANLATTDRETIEAVLEYYGDKSAQWLSDLTHKEDPWREARKYVPELSRSTAKISHAAMAEYYGSLAD